MNRHSGVRTVTAFAASVFAGDLNLNSLPFSAYMMSLSVCKGFMGIRTVFTRLPVCTSVPSFPSLRPYLSYLPPNINTKYPILRTLELYYIPLCNNNF